MKMQNPLINCFTQDIIQITTAEMLIKFILKSKRTYHHQCILMSVMPLILAGDYELESLENFFIDVNGESHHEELDLNTVGWKICSNNLESFASTPMLYYSENLHFAEDVYSYAKQVIYDHQNSDCTHHAGAEEKLYPVRYNLLDYRPCNLTFYL